MLKKMKKNTKILSETQKRKKKSQKVTPFEKEKGCVRRQGLYLLVAAASEGP